MHISNGFSLFDVSVSFLFSEYMNSTLVYFLLLSKVGNRLLFVKEEFLLRYPYSFVLLFPVEGNESRFFSLVVINLIFEIPFLCDAVFRSLSYSENLFGYELTTRK
eukprot:TRINITY_DN20588_c0_g1_i2.p1 TRINITY_DN20588_c0_g1~~TRINITY_DN20588_c0_g1_i2.p1  ORF type:complete len:106 (-),score=1.66 TRINITY_DN20588_c0_g1_i2:44-361(-)